MLSQPDLWKWLIVFCIPFLNSCSVSQHTPAPLQDQVSIAPIRFLLTFDDGPSGANRNNPTQKILDVLAQNSVQPDIKAVFFVQTRAVRGGSTSVGQALLQRAHAEGHLLALHTATKHHDNHRFLKAEDLDISLQLGIQDLVAISGSAPRLVRPPFWSYNTNTLSNYHRLGLQMLLTDLSANDGKIHGVNWSWRKRSNLLYQLRQMKVGLANGRFPIIDGSIPVVVTFHDVNTYTARNMDVYLQILLQVAKELNLLVAEKPFYDDSIQLEKAASMRTVRDSQGEHYIPGFWGWLWGLQLN